MTLRTFETDQWCMYCSKAIKAGEQVSAQKGAHGQWILVHVDCCRPLAEKLVEQVRRRDNVLG